MRSVCFACVFTILTSTIALAGSHAVPLLNQPLVPASVKPGHKGFTLTVNGTGFASTAVLNWNGSPRATSVLSSSSLQATISAADVAKAGTASVTVVNPGSARSNVIYFPIRRPLSTVALALDQNFAGSAAVAVGDFNGDGKLDIATAGESYGIQLWPGNGNGTFGTPVWTNTTFIPFLMIAADFNGDGRPDLAVSDGSGTTSVFLSNTDGTFTETSALAPGPSSALAAADFNGDGNLDLYTSGWYGGVYAFRIFLGSGNGEFQSARTTLTTSPSGTPAIGDFNQDGKLDLALTDGQLFLGNGDGTFQTPVNYPGGGTTMAAADVNGDGKLDLINDEVCVFLGNGDGTFSDGTCTYTEGPSYNISLGDFNGDGKLDVAVVPFKENGEQNYQNLAVLLGNGDGTFQAPVELPAGIFYYGIGLGAGDFSGDGKLDFAVGSTPSGLLFLQTVASLSPPNLVFPDQDVGTTSQPQIATLANIGSSALVIKHIGISGTNLKDFAQKNNCGSSLPADSSCQISVTFTPKAVGTRLASLNVSYKGVGSPQSVALSGTGISESVSLTPSHLKFPTQLVGTSSSPQTATLTNTGSGTVTISSIATSGSFHQTNNCPSSLLVGSNCQIQVTFTPTAKGPTTGKLSVTDDAKGSPQSTSLSGTGTVVELQPIGVNFGNQKVGTKSQPVPVTLTNIGTTALSISKIAFTGADPGDFSQTNNCGNSVPAGGNCTIKVRFEPKAKGQRSANLAVSDDGGGSPQTIPVVGTGT